MIEYLRSPALWVIACAVEAIAILLLSVIPSVGEGINGGITAHLSAYAVFSCTTGILLLVKKIPRALLKGALIAALYGCVIELVQFFIPYRACEAADFAVDLIASGTGMAAAFLLQCLFFREVSR